MNVSCTSCSAKYAIPDEKVRGKKVKITCKHCGTGIIVDGTKLDAAADAAPAAAAPTSLAPAAAPAAVPAAAPVAAAAPMPSALAATPAGTPAAKAASLAPAAKAGAPEELRFDIAYPDDRQETLGVGEIVAKYAAGTLDDEAFLWREGMTDWKAPFDIPELAGALTAQGLKKKAAEAGPFVEEDEATRIQESPFDGLETSSARASEWHEPGKEAPSSPEAAFALTAKPGGSGLPFEQAESAAPPEPAVASPKPAVVTAMKAEAPKPSAARRSAARGGGDLFGDLAAAGSEADESLGAETKDAPKMTGARNESSVLFSLDALVKQEKPAPKKSAPREDAASILMGDTAGPSSISNIGTGQFGSAFAAPDFTAPVAAAPIMEARPSDPVEMSAAAPKKGGMGLWIGLGVLVAAAGAAFATGLPAKLMGAPPATPSASPAAKQEPAPTPAPEAPAPTPAPAAASASAAPAAGGAAAVAPAAGGAAAVVSKPADPAKPDPAKPADAAKPAEPAKPTDAASTAEKPAAPASDAPPFDKAAAVAALTAAAGNAGSCKTPDGPTGSGKVSITFMPSGRATNTQVSGDLAGTAVGGCVARLFRSAKIPAFSGEAVTVSKSFSVQ